jgi:hypothetical protein
VTITVTSPLFAQENGPDHLPGGQWVEVQVSTKLASRASVGMSTDFVSVLDYPNLTANI